MNEVTRYIRIGRKLKNKSAFKRESKELNRPFYIIAIMISLTANIITFIESYSITPDLSVIRPMSYILFVLLALWLMFKIILYYTMSDAIYVKEVTKRK